MGNKISVMGERGLSRPWCVAVTKCMNFVISITVVIGCHGSDASSRSSFTRVTRVIGERHSLYSCHGWASRAWQISRAWGTWLANRSLSRAWQVCRGLPHEKRLYMISSLTPVNQVVGIEISEREYFFPFSSGSPVTYCFSRFPLTRKNLCFHSTFLLLHAVLHCKLLIDPSTVTWAFRKKVSRSSWRELHDHRLKYLYGQWVIMPPLRSFFVDFDVLICIQP